MAWWGDKRDYLHGAEGSQALPQRRVTFINTQQKGAVFICAWLLLCMSVGLRKGSQSRRRTWLRVCGLAEEAGINTAQTHVKPAGGWASQLCLCHPVHSKHMHIFSLTKFPTGHELLFSRGSTENSEANIEPPGLLWLTNSTLTCLVTSQTGQCIIGLLAASLLLGCVTWWCDHWLSESCSLIHSQSWQQCKQPEELRRLCARVCGWTTAHAAEQCLAFRNDNVITPPGIITVSWRCLQREITIFSILWYIYIRDTGWKVRDQPLLFRKSPKK